MSADIGRNRWDVLGLNHPTRMAVLVLGSVDVRINLSLEREPSY